MCFHLFVYNCIKTIWPFMKKKQSSPPPHAAPPTFYIFEGLNHWPSKAVTFPQLGVCQELKMYSYYFEGVTKPPTTSKSTKTVPDKVRNQWYMVGWLLWGGGDIYRTTCIFCLNFILSSLQKLRANQTVIF